LKEKTDRFVGLMIWENKVVLQRIADIFKGFLRKENFTFTGVAAIDNISRDSIY